MKLKSRLMTIYIMLFMCVFLCVNVQAAEVTFTWNAVTEADGYKIYWKIGETGPPYDGAGHDVNGEEITSPIKVTATTGKIVIPPGDYRFAVTAFNNYGESGYSEELGPVTIAPKEIVAAVITVTPVKDTIHVTWEYEDSGPLDNFMIVLQGRDPVELPPTAREYTFVDIPNGTYSVVLNAVNVESNVSSNTVNVDVTHVETPDGFNGKILYIWENGYLQNVIIF